MPELTTKTAKRLEECNAFIKMAETHCVDVEELSQIIGEKVAIINFKNEFKEIIKNYHKLGTIGFLNKANNFIQEIESVLKCQE